jgi:hypothetical protein
MVIEEIASFPRAKHDDLVDTASSALKKLRELGIVQHSAEVEADKLERIFRAARDLRVSVSRRNTGCKLGQATAWPKGAIISAGQCQRTVEDEQARRAQHPATPCDNASATCVQRQQQRGMLRECTHANQDGPIGH